jgi:glycosyltransferase involved in cell wall biosynthesis
MMVIVIPGGERKGADYLIRALPQMRAAKKPRILVVGSKGLLKSVPAEFNLHETGYLQSREEVLKCYSASDFIVLPTLADNLPVTLLEAAACGIPAVAFNAGGVPDIVRHMETGYLAAYKDVEDLAKGIDVFVENDELRSITGARARKIAETEYAAGIQVRRYEDLYRNLHIRRASHRS